MANTKWIKIGAIWKRKDKPGSYLAVTLKQNKDEVLEEFTLKPGMFLNVQNPRQSEHLSEEQKAKIPEGLLAEVSVGIDE